MKPIFFKIMLFLTMSMSSAYLMAQTTYCSGSYVSNKYDSEKEQWILSYIVDGVSIQITTCFTFSKDNSTIQVKNNRSLDMTLNVDTMIYDQERRVSVYICNSGPLTFYQITKDLFNNKILLLTSGNGEIVEQEHFIKQ